MVVGFVSCLLAGALRAALLSCRAYGPLVCKAGQQRAMEGCLACCSILLGQQKRAAPVEPPFVGRFALSSVISIRRKLRDNGIYRAAKNILFGCSGFSEHVELKDLGGTVHWG